jgi:transcriptional regulator with XRE-family HTH domain
MSELGERLRKLRLNKGLSQEQLANQVGLKQASISQFEKGQRLPTPATIRKLASALGIEPVMDWDRSSVTLRVRPGDRIQEVFERMLDFWDAGYERVEFVHNGRHVVMGLAKGTEN